MDTFQMVFREVRRETISQNPPPRVEEERRLIQGSKNVIDTRLELRHDSSKKLTDRPEGARLLAILKPGDVLLTPKLDRMFRSALDALDVLAQLQRAGIALHMIDLGGDVTGNGISKLVFTILSAVAEAERDRIRERIRDVRIDQRNRSRYLGGKVPFGWTVDSGGALVAHGGQQQAIARMKELRSAGHSLRSIATTLAADSFDLSHAGVKKILLSAGS